jgi:hypothetical protein
MMTSSQKNSFAIYYDGCLYNFSRKVEIPFSPVFTGFLSQCMCPFILHIHISGQSKNSLKHCIRRAIFCPGSYGKYQRQGTKNRGKTGHDYQPKTLSRCFTQGHLKRITKRQQVLSTSNLSH